MTTDARTQYTKMMVRKALLTLLQEKPIDKITVKEISGLAGINRATFYRHYSDQYALLDELEEEKIQDVQNKVLAGSDRWEEVIRHMLGLLYEDREEWTLLLGPNADPRISGRISKLFYELFLTHSPSESQKMRYRFLAYGCGGMISDWVHGGMKERPEEIAECLVSCAHDLGHQG